MTNSVDTIAPALRAQAGDSPLNGGGPATSRALRITFTGSGSEYFRLWVVNMLLTLVTLGLYLPFAKVRRLSYFYANTRIDDHCLAFHGNPWRMLRGFLLVAVLMLVYGLGVRISPTAAVVSFAIFCLVWPALWRASMQFRLSNTSWRGLRFAFRGSLAGAYRAYFPLLASIFAFVATTQWMAPRPGDGPANPAKFDPNLGWVMLACTVFMAILVPWGLALVKRYQHGGYVYADQQTQLFTPTSRFYGLAIKGTLIYLASLVLVLAAVALLALAVTLIVSSGAASDLKAYLEEFKKEHTVLILSVGFGVLYLLSLSLVSAYFSARMQDIVWGGTRSEAVGFTSALKVWRLTRLNLKNWILTGLTLSLYRPFAAINLARLRLESVSIMVDTDIDQWNAAHVSARKDAAGEAAGDFFGIDIGL